MFDNYIKDFIMCNVNNNDICIKYELITFEQRLYKTGDWGYMLSDGSFEICGRCDSMVKIRGYSIETQVNNPLF